VHSTQLDSISTAMFSQGNITRGSITGDPQTIFCQKHTNALED